MIILLYFFLCPLLAGDKLLPSFTELVGDTEFILLKKTYFLKTEMATVKQCLNKKQQ